MAIFQWVNFFTEILAMLDERGKSNLIHTRIYEQIFMNIRFSSQIQKSILQSQCGAKYGVLYSFPMFVAFAVVRLSRLKMPLSSVDTPTLMTPSPSMCLIFSSLNRTYII